MIYLDHNATTPPAKDIVEYFADIAHKAYNASSIHNLGRNSTYYIEQAKNSIKTAINANNYDVIFTSSGTEANNLALLGLKNIGKPSKLIISGKEHPSIMQTAINNREPEVCLLKLHQNGLIDKSHLQELLLGAKDIGNSPAPSASLVSLVSIMMACNETGVLENMEEIAGIILAAKGFLHTDLTQAVAKIPIDLDKINADMATISAHKIGGIQGVAALLYKKGLEFKPIITGGGQQKSFRAGTEPVALIASFGKAMERAKAKLGEYKKHTETLRDYLEVKLKEKFGQNVVIFAENAPRLPNTSMFAIKNMPSDIMLIKCDIEGICISSGSACSSGKIEPSRTILNMGYSKEIANSALRISIGCSNNKQEIDKLLAVI